MPRPLVTLTTDFGADSPCVAQVKGRLLSMRRNVRIVDACIDDPQYLAPDNGLLDAVVRRDGAG